MKELIKKIVEIVKQVQFVSFDYRTKIKCNAKGVQVDGGELSRYTMILGASYLRLLEQSLLALRLFTNRELMAIAEKSKDLMVIHFIFDARNAVIASLEKSIEAHKAGLQNPDYTKAGQYQQIAGGLNLNLNDNSLQLFGLVQSKVTLEKGMHKVVNSAPLTIAKNLIRKELPIGKFREFALDLDTVSGARINGSTLEFDLKPSMAEVKEGYDKAQAEIGKAQAANLPERPVGDWQGSPSYV